VRELEVSAPGGPRGADVVIIGGGLVGLATAAALGERGANVILLEDHRKGMASTAAAGMLAPAMERGTSGSAAHAFALAARDLYPSYLDALAEVTGVRVPLNRDGVLQLIVDEGEADAHRREIESDSDGGAEWLDSARLRSLEPELAPIAGAVLYPRDGSVDNVVLVRALETLVAASPSVNVVDGCAKALELDGRHVGVILGSGARYESPTVVLAAGAWSPLVDGLPRAIPVEPVRGQAISLSSAPLRHVTYGPHGYIVPREGSRSVVGATMEHVGFDTGVTAETAPRLVAAAREIAPAFARAHTLGHWSGLRPVTPDLLPIIGRDPSYPGLIYACGHSRNGVLLSPLTGECVADIATGSAPPVDITPFAVERFAA
jgi:glycine oxidase